MVLIETSSSVGTRFGAVQVDTGGRGDRPLIAITPLGSAWLAEALPAAIGELFTVHIIELLGTGRSAASDAAPSIEQVTATVEDVATALGRSDVVLFGHSMNGALVLAAAATAAATATATATALTIAGIIAVTPPPRLPPDAADAFAYWDAKAEPARKELASEILAARRNTRDDAEKIALQHRYERLLRWYDLAYDPSDLAPRHRRDVRALGARAVRRTAGRVHCSGETVAGRQHRDRF